MTYDELIAVLLSDKPSDWIRNNEDLVFNFIPELRKCKGFDQKNEWHVYDVYEHILHVVDGVFNNDCLRLAALFHDIGKPLSFIEDENGVGHFYGHWDKSNEIFREFAKKNNLSSKRKKIKTDLYNETTNNAVKNMPVKKKALNSSKIKKHNVKIKLMK